jgi:Ribonuclease HII
MPSIICGIDEAGRGCLAGPVVSAAIIIDKAGIPEGVDDSKKLSDTKRRELCKLILKYAAAYSIGLSSNKEVDMLNVLKASLLSMERAFAGLPFNPDIVIVDGPFVPPALALLSKKQGLKAIPVIKGDEKVRIVSCASIVAKVFRDDIMLSLDRRYPQYGFKNHKGYGTKEHKENLERFGMSEIHRKTFKF